MAMLADNRSETISFIQNNTILCISDRLFFFLCSITISIKMARAICPIITALAVCALVGVFPHAMAEVKEAYTEARERLVNSDCDASYGYVQYGDYTDKEKQLHNIIMNLKFKDQETFYPEMSMQEFHVHVAKSELFKIIEAMPKFGLLRAHIGSLLDPKDLMEIAEQFCSDLYICCQTDGNDPLKLSFEEVKGLCEPNNPNKPNHEWLKLDTIKTRRTGNDPQTWTTYRNDLIDKLSISNEANGYEEFADHDAAWKRFDEQYGWSNLLKYEPVWEKVMEKIIDRGVEQNIQYLEIHATLSKVSRHSTRCLPNTILSCRATIIQ